MTLKELDRWHKTRVGYAVFGAVELVLTYVSASLAIDRAGIWYLFTFIFAFGTLRNLMKCVFFKRSTS